MVRHRCYPHDGRRMHVCGGGPALAAFSFRPLDDTSPRRRPGRRRCRPNVAESQSAAKVMPRSPAAQEHPGLRLGHFALVLPAVKHDTRRPAAAARDRSLMASATSRSRRPDDVRLVGDQTSSQRGSETRQGAGRFGTRPAPDRHGGRSPLARDRTSKTHSRSGRPLAHGSSAPVAQRRAAWESTRRVTATGTTSTPGSTHDALPEGEGANVIVTSEWAAAPPPPQGDVSRWILDGAVQPEVRVRQHEEPGTGESTVMRHAQLRTVDLGDRCGEGEHGVRSA